MVQRRRLTGKKLLIVSAGLASAALAACGDDTTMPRDAVVANLVGPPEDSGLLDAPAEDSGGGTDDGGDVMDAPATDGDSMDGN